MGAKFCTPEVPPSGGAMSDELLRYLSTNAGKLKKTPHIQQHTGTSKERFEGDSWLRVLLAICYHANSYDRQCFAGIVRLATEAGTNRDTVYEVIENFVALGWLTPRAPRRMDSTHKKSVCWEVTLPNLLPLDYWVQQQAAQDLSRADEAERRRLVKAEAKKLRQEVPEKVPEKVPENVPPDNSKSVTAQGLNENALREHKHKYKPPVKTTLKLVKSENRGEVSLIEQTLNLYAELTLNKTPNAITNKDAYRARVIANASKLETPKGCSYREHAQHLLNLGYKVKDIAAFLADGATNGQGIVHWDKRQDFQRSEAG